jgi:hypothetical protein
VLQLGVELVSPSFSMTSSFEMVRYRIRMWWWRLPGKTKLWLIVSPQLLIVLWLFLFATPSDKVDESTMKDIPLLIDWVKRSGMEIPKVEIIMTWKGKTMIALEDIPPGDLFRVPYSLLLCGYLNDSPHVTENPAWQLIASLDFSSHWTEALLMLAEKQRGDKAWFAPYLNTLTKREDLSLPLFWEDPAEVQAIEGSKLRHWLVDATREEFNSYWPTVEKLVRNNPSILDPNIFTYRNFEWASSLIWSHAFNTYKGDVTFATAVPLVDLMNHDATMNTWWEIEDSTNHWVLKTATPFKKGDEIRITYGDMPNVRLLKWFGFAIEENIEDELYLELTLFKDDPNSYKKQPFMDWIGWDWLGVTENKWPEKAMAAARVVVLSADEFESQIIRNTEKNENPPWVKLSCKNELAALDYLLDTVNFYMGEYTTTIEEDEQLLRKKLSKNMRHAIITRKGHKIIWQSFKNKILLKKEEEKTACSSED